jgi:PilZ domain
MHERRRTFRNRTFFGGEIAFNRRSSTLNCVVRNLTADGALLVFENIATVPDKFDLTIERKERSFRARMVWRRTNDAGVEFMTEHIAAEPIPLEWAKRLRDCETEKATLLRRIEDLSTAG